MGTWGMKVFESDNTLDWLWDVKDSHDTALLAKAVNPEETSYLEASEGELILAAAEIISGLRGKPREGLPEQALTWIGNHKSLDVSELVPKAVAGIDLVLSEQSELNDLWKESPDYNNWVEDVKQLKALLGA